MILFLIHGNDIPEIKPWIFRRAYFKNFSKLTSGCFQTLHQVVRRFALHQPNFLFLSNRIYKFMKKSAVYEITNLNAQFFVWLSSFAWVTLASSYSLNCTYHRCLFTSRWRTKCCTLIVLHLFMNISYGAYSMCCAAMKYIYSK